MKQESGRPINLSISEITLSLWKPTEFPVLLTTFSPTLTLLTLTPLCNEPHYFHKRQRCRRRMTPSLPRRGATITIKLELSLRLTFPLPISLSSLLSTSSHSYSRITRNYGIDIRLQRCRWTYRLPIGHCQHWQPDLVPDMGWRIGSLQDISHSFWSLCSIKFIQFFSLFCI